MKIAITGKIGSGKSTFARALSCALKPWGYRLLDVDSLSPLTREHPLFKARCVEIFGTLNREDISRACFSNPELRVALEEESLPVWTALLHAEMAHENLVIDFPLLMESQLARSPSTLCVGVDSDLETRALRAQKRLGWDRDRFDAVDALQIGARAKMSYCDFWYSNAGLTADLEVQAAKLASEIVALDRIAPLCLPVIGPLAFKQVARAHAHPARHYHGATHLASIFTKMDPDLIQDPALVMATCYHDFIFETGPNYAQSEALSVRELSRQAADLFPQWLDAPRASRGTASLAPVALACALIDATKGHKISDPWLLSEPSRLFRAQSFLDADLSIIGASTDSEFWAYDEAIGREFSHVPRPLYHQLRAQAMAGFIDPTLRSTLYLTPTFASFESCARTRLSALVDKHLILGQNTSLHLKEPL